MLSSKARLWCGVAIGSVWVFHGLYSKVLLGVPRHRLIVGRILGGEIAAPATLAIGIGEVLLGLWVFTGFKARSCAVLQTVLLVTMYALEISLARDLLISAWGMVLLNIGFLALVWLWAASASQD